jgi:hypothetical protein
MLRRAAWALLAAAITAACELQEVTVVDFTDVVVGEVYVQLAEEPQRHLVRAFIHGTAAGGEPDSETFDDALVRITREDGLVLDLALGQIPECVVAEGATGSCFVDGGLASGLVPGDALSLTIGLADGRTLLGGLTIPGDFQLDGITAAACRLPPDTLLDVRWTRSSGAWAYVNETSINGLRDALASDSIEVEEDPLHLLGLSITAADTTVVFPSEFGIFDRFDLDQDLAVRLQRGLPDGTDALVTVAAVERNYVNWARGGNFNPSGQVRVASIRGDGTGVFGAAVVRSFSVVASAAPGGPPDCPLS